MASPKETLVRLAFSDLLRLSKIQEVLFVPSLKKQTFGRLNTNFYKGYFVSVLPVTDFKK